MPYASQIPLSGHLAPQLRRAWAALCLSLIVAGCSGSTDPRWADDPQLAEGSRVVGIPEMKPFTRCALTDSHLLYCYGDGYEGQMGNGSTQYVPTPAVAAGGMEFRSVHGNGNSGLYVLIGSITCGITHEDQAYCWGLNFDGSVGDGTTTTRLSPSAVAGNHRFREIEIGAFHTCGITVQGALLCWGSAYSGELGVGFTTQNSFSVPTPVSAGGTWKQVTAGYAFTCALRENGEALCTGWGVGLGSGGIDRAVSEFTPVSGNHRFSRISAGSEWVCALDLEGAPWCWGKTGIAADDFRPVPRAVPTNLRFRDLMSGDEYGACGLTEAGEVYCWRHLRPPYKLSGRHRFAGLSNSRDMYCGFTPGGATYCWEWILIDNETVNLDLSDPWLEFLLPH